MNEEHRALSDLLDGEVDKPFNSLSESLKKIVREAFFPMKWDDLVPEQRRSLAAQYDYQYDPAREEEHEFYWESVLDHDKILTEITDTELLKPVTVQDQLTKKKMLKELNGARESNESERYQCSQYQRIGTPSCEPSAAEGLGVFQALPQLNFSEILILVDPEQLTLCISARGIQKRVPFATLGLTQKNLVTLNAQGNTFMSLGNQSFRINDKGSKKAIARLSKCLRDAFGTKDKPFRNYIPEFGIRIPKDKESARRGRRKTISYDDQVASASASEDVDMEDEFIRNHDASYDDQVASASASEDVDMADEFLRNHDASYGKPGSNYCTESD